MKEGKINLWTLISSGTCVHVCDLGLTQAEAEDILARSLARSVLCIPLARFDPGHLGLSPVLSFGRFVYDKCEAGWG